MHILDIFARDKVTISFEFFPPKTDTGWDALFSRISQFESLDPSFVSVTYGAGGSTRKNTHDLVLRLLQQTGLDAMPHLTCIGHSDQEIQELLLKYAQAGVSNILALRGDLPSDLAETRTSDFNHAADLVRAIAKFNDSGACSDPRGFGIGVAGFPEGHPDTPNCLEQMDHLKAKVDAGADYICTQLFFNNDLFFDFRERCEIAGINVPIIAGIMPITSTKVMNRMADLAGGMQFPPALLRTIDRCNEDQDLVSKAGIHWATEQCRDLVDRGARGIHFYTLNKSDATQCIHNTLGLSRVESS
ncbi:MAG: methylenetetrahydrofolate reductase [NAD(P)H] [Phycisphaerae bacterium]|nr:methylenetetrahydrofolate reductase [NAD(P)H] [Phycisphaerae bacterium]